MNTTNIKAMIDKNIIDFKELVLNHYHKIDLDETDAIMIIKLHNLLQKNITFINPTKFSNMLSISSSTTMRRLNNLIEKGYIQFELVKNTQGKETEIFNLDNVIEKILIAQYEERKKNENATEAPEQELVHLFESEFRKPLSVLDIQTITKWLEEDKYSIEEIKHALYEAVKANKLSIRYIDGILLNITREDEKPKYNQSTIIKDLKKLWTE